MPFLSAVKLQSKKKSLTIEHDAYRITIYFWDDDLSAQCFQKFVQPNGFHRTECFLCGEILANSSMK